MTPRDLELGGLDDTHGEALRALESELRGELLATLFNGLHRLTGHLTQNSATGSARVLHLIRAMGGLSSEIEQTFRRGDELVPHDEADENQSYDAPQVADTQRILESVLTTAGSMQAQSEEQRVSALLGSLPPVPPTERLAFVRERLTGIVGAERAEALLAERAPATPPPVPTVRKAKLERKVPTGTLVPRDVSEALDAATLPGVHATLPGAHTPETHLRAMLCALIPGQFDELVGIYLNMPELATRDRPQRERADSVVARQAKDERGLQATITLIQHHYFGG